MQKKSDPISATLYYLNCYQKLTTTKIKYKIRVVSLKNKKMNQKPHRINLDTLLVSETRPSARYSQQVHRSYYGSSFDGVSRAQSRLFSTRSQDSANVGAMNLSFKTELHVYTVNQLDKAELFYDKMKTGLLSISSDTVQKRTRNVFKKTNRYLYQTRTKKVPVMRLSFAGLFLFVGLGLGIFGTLFVSSQPQSGSVLSLSTSIDKGVNPDDADITTPVTQVGSIPRSIEIPSLSMSADIRSVGVTKTGAIAVTPRLNEVGWYKNSRAPGDGGTAVLVGHYNGDKPAAFQHLKDIQIGQYIEIKRSDNAVIKYQVISTQVYDKQDVPMKDILSDSADKALLKIVTCEGLWLKNEHTYSKRLLVIAEQVS